MAEVIVVSAGSAYFQGVQELWRANSGTLGFFPEGAFAERAQKGQILAAIDDSTVVGYVLYYTDKYGKVRLSHLCVDESRRRTGVARLLIDCLRARTKAAWGIGLYCRRDFPAWYLWPNLGFHAVADKVGRSKDGHELTCFWSENPHRTLLSTAASADKDRLIVVIDANIFYDLHDPSRSGGEETAGLTVDWLQPSIQLSITQELLNELHRNDDTEERRHWAAVAQQYERIECDAEDFQNSLDSVKRLLGTPRTLQDASDQRHLACSIAAHAEVFVTRDEALLGLSDEIYEYHGLSVIRPSQLVGRYEELRNERDYQRNRLAGSDVRTQRISRASEELLDAFHVPTEKKWKLSQLLNTVTANPDEYQCHVVSSGDGKPLALYVLDFSAHSLNIPAFRIRHAAAGVQLASTLTRTLLAGIVQTAIAHNKCAVRIAGAGLSSVVCNALGDSGFVAERGSWVKLVIRGLAHHTEVANRIESAAGMADINVAAFTAIQELVTTSSFCSNVESVLQVEHLLWPLKVTGTTVPNYVIPIRPNWAADLFDAGLAKNRLWGSDAQLALNPVSAYYRSPKPKVLQPQGRVLWYVSDDEAHGSKMIRACSQITRVLTGKPKEIFRQFRRYGVFDWPHVLKSAGGLDNDVMAVEFSDTELFKQPISWRDIQSTLHRHGMNSTFPSPVAIKEEIFLDFYKQGTGESIPSQGK